MTEKSIKYNVHPQLSPPPSRGRRLGWEILSLRGSKQDIKSKNEKLLTKNCLC